MGWTSFRLEEPVKDWFTKTAEWNGRKVLAVSVVRFKELYAAVQLEDGSVICYTYMLSWHPKAWNNFAYKDMTEFSGPYMYDCPDRILKLLTPLPEVSPEDDSYNEYKYAIDFRYRNMMRRSYQKALRRLKVGETFHTITKVPMSFIGGAEEFKKTSDKNIYLASNDFGKDIRVKVTNIYQYGIR